MTEIKKIGKSEVEITAIIPWENWEKFVGEAVKEAAKDVKIEGFRPGKAPRELIEQKVGKDYILNVAAEKAIGKNYPEVIETEKIDPIGAPKVQITKIAEGNELEYKVVTAVMPELKMGAWEKSVKAVNKNYEGKKAEASDEDIKKELEKIANSRVQLVTVDREAKKGDSVNIDFQVFQSGVAIENGTSKKHDLILGRGVFIPGFEEKMIGAKAGEEKEFELEFPKEYHAKHLAGKPAQFKVKINAVQERKTPEISDAFAVSLGKFKNLEELKKNIKEGLQMEKEKQQNEQRRGEIVEALIKDSTIDIPELLIHEELHRMMHEFEGQLQGMGMQFDQYLKQVNKTKDAMEKEWRPQAEKRIKAALALENVAKIKEIEVPKEEIEKEMNKTLQYYKNVKNMEKNIDLKALYNYTKGILVNEEVFKMLEKIK